LRTVLKINAAAFSATSSKRETAINRAAYAPDARSLAILEGVRIAQEDLREAGGAYDLDQVRTLMHGVSRQAIDKRVQEGSLLAVPGPSNRRSYPTLQFNSDGTVVEGLKAVSEALPTRNPWSILNCVASGALRPYWVNTASTDLLQDLIARRGLGFSGETGLAGRTKIFFSRSTAWVSAAARPMRSSWSTA